MMSPGNEQGTPKGGQNQSNEAGANDKSKPQDSTGPQPGYGPQGGSGPWPGWPGGYGMPPWGMPPWGMPGSGMPPGGMPPWAHHHHHHHRPWDPYQPQNAPWPWAWMSSLMPWLGPWWSWLSSWFVFPGFSWMTSPFMPFMPFAPFMPPPFPPGPPDGSTLRFAETRASFWRHWFEAIAEIWRQAANASYVPGTGPAGGPPPWCPPWCPPPQVDLAQLKDAIKNLPEPQIAFVIHAVCALQAWDGVRQQGRTGPDW
jgi:hypothetical protein